MKTARLLPYASSVALLAMAGFSLLRFSLDHPGGPAAAFSRQRQRATAAQVTANYLRLPLRFEENRGQTDAEARFVARGLGYTLFLTEAEAVLALAEEQTPGTGSEKKQIPRRDVPRDDIRRGGQLGYERSAVPAQSQVAVVRMKMAGANDRPAVVGEEELPGRSNYLIGNDPAQWRSGVPAYSKVRYREIYPGVDLIYYGNSQRLEYDFIVAPGASPQQIEMEVSGADALRLDADGDLLITAAGQSLRLHRPIVYQETVTEDAPAARRAIAGSYVLRGERRVAFEIAAYDARLPLVIDPVLTYSTYLGGNGFDQIEGIAVDAGGNIYVTGLTTSTDFPTASPLQGNQPVEDIFVSKLDSQGGQLLYSTYLGGNDTDVAQAIAVDSSGASATVGGYTYSTNFPVASAFQNAKNGSATADAFVARLNEAGSALIFSTYLGGSDDDVGLDITVDSDGNSYAVGQTTSGNFPVSASGFQRIRGSTIDSFVTKLAPAGNALVYSTYLGGNNEDAAFGVAADAAGNAYVTGYTASNNFPVPNGFQTTYGGGTCISGQFLVPCLDGFVAKLNPVGTQLVYGTYLGGNSDDIAFAVAVDSADRAHVTGITISQNFPTQNALQGTLGGLEDAFVTKLSPEGSALVYSTYLGGTVEDQGNAIAVDSAGSAIVTGFTDSSNFPLLNPIQDRDGFDAFITKLSPAGSSLIYSTYLGGNGADQAAAVTLDSTGNVYVAGSTNSDNFPVVNPFQSSYIETVCGSPPNLFFCLDGFIARLALQPSLFPGGLVNGGSFAPSSAVAAGSIASAFGSEIASSVAFAANVPLPTTLANLTVRMNGIAAPLFFVAGGQVNLQVPWELAGQSQVSVQASVGNTALAPITVSLASAAPGLFTTNSQGTGQGAVQISSTGEFAAPANSIPGAAARPVPRGEFITIFCTGLGPVTNRPATGAAGPPGPNLAVAATTPVVTIGGIAATVSFAGLAPGFVGLYQINAQVPPNAQPGNTVPVAVSVAGAASNTVTIAVQ